MSFEHNPTAEVEALYQRIHANEMADMPVLNTALAVEALGFERCAYGWLGILITPWFMNLLLLPATGVTWTSVPAGKPRSLSFASGDYIFNADRETTLGEFLSCQLFSPMYHFPDQDTARIAARAALAAVLSQPGSPTQPEKTDTPASPSKRRFLRGNFLEKDHKSN